MLNVEYSPPRRGGEAAASTKSCEATEKRRRRARSASAIARSRNSGQLGEIFRPEQLRRTDHPGRAVSERIHFYLWRFHPPLPGGEYSTFNISSIIHTFYERPRCTFCAPS